MKANRKPKFKRKKNEVSISEFVATNYIIIIVAIFLFIGFVIPTQSVVSVVLTYNAPINDWSFNVGYNKMPYLQYLLYNFGVFGQPQDTSLGDVNVTLTIKNSMNQNVFGPKTYFIGRGIYTLQTFHAPVVGETLLVEIPSTNYRGQASIVQIQ